MGIKAFDTIELKLARIVSQSSRIDLAIGMREVPGGIFDGNTRIVPED